MHLIGALKKITEEEEDNSAAVFGKLMALWMKDIPKEKMRDFQIKMMVFVDDYIKECEMD